MAILDNVQELIDKLKNGSLPLSEVRALLNHQSPIVRVNALNALVSQVRFDDSVVDDIANAALAHENAVCLMGTASVAHVAVGCLYQIGTPSAIAAATSLLKMWPEPDRTDLMWYLKAEGIKAV